MLWVFLSGSYVMLHANYFPALSVLVHVTIYYAICYSNKNMDAEIFEFCDPSSNGSKILCCWYSIYVLIMFMFEDKRIRGCTFKIEFYLANIHTTNNFKNTLLQTMCTFSRLPNNVPNKNSEKFFRHNANNGDSELFLLFAKVSSWVLSLVNVRAQFRSPVPVGVS